MMTPTHDAPASPTTVDAGPLTLSARIRQPGSAPRGVIVALHGGTYDASYYDTGADSLLDLGPALGWLVVAVDRPGYGATHGADPKLLTFDAQTEILSEAVRRVWTDLGQRAGLVLIGHSVGGMLALCVAAAQSASRSAVPLRGVEVSGLGELWQPGLREMWGSLIGDAPEVTVPPDAHNQVMYGPAGTFDPAGQATFTAWQRPMPMPELIDVVDWSGRLPAVAAAVDVPVRATLAEHDNIWRSDEAARAALAGHFTGDAPARVEPFPGAGHSIELHRNARAYVLRQLAFAEECLAASDPARPPAG
ncbi:MAG: alpha/beta hydrolase [Actinobacteria bacterium]|nr:alpha/beta hydrolase [Actinomycetota bacterium]